MKTNPFTKTRLTESQELLRSVMSESLGIYMAKEPKNEDQWREQEYWQILDHLKHEIEEIQRSQTLDRKYHNALDCIGQASILAAHLRLRMEDKK
jgi:hypothetical protein